MENKYYTPSIKEFHVGFEYEQEDINEGGSSLSWYKYTIKEGEAYIIDQLITNEDLGLSYRVKYLDREDIESLGFTDYKHSVMDWWSKKGYFDSVGGRYRFDEYKLRYNLKDQELHIEAFFGGSSEGMLFEGIIKNKSELKVLLKQLNIK
jgi:hypothetical protein